MQQHPQVVAADAIVPADLIFIAFLEKNLADQPAVPLRHFFQDFPNLLFHLLCGDGAENIDQGIGEILIRVPIERTFTASAAVMLEQNVTAR